MMTQKHRSFQHWFHICTMLNCSDTGVSVERRLVCVNLMLLGQDHVTGGIMFLVVDDVIFIEDLHFVLIYTIKIFGKTNLRKILS